MNKIINYLKASRLELMKVVWPSRKQTIQYTIEVIVVSAIVAIFLGGVDYLLTFALQSVLK